MTLPNAVSIQDDHSLILILEKLTPKVKEFNKKININIGSGKRDSLLIRKQIEDTIITPCMEIISNYKTQRQQQQNNGVTNYNSKLNKDIETLIQEYEVLLKEYYKKKLQYPIYKDNNGTTTVIHSSDNNQNSTSINSSNNANNLIIVNANDRSENDGYISMPLADEDKPLLSTSSSGMVPPNHKNYQSQQQLLIQEEGEQQQQQLFDNIDQEQVDFHQLVVTERDTQMDRIHGQVKEVNAIFQQLGSIIKQQGEQVDDIENNINNFSDNVQNASAKLVKAEKVQKTGNRCRIILLIVIGMIVLIILLAV
ncbi:uncharacterized protein SCODWIG_00684 [Saccharomycodes ludwigii]|uniref:t-SNARE coiled-coil homology domain-containing protein n=1 Tax=Saccharomycodes ludwigii TaxID=36035 RepID=A0A376B2M0_9ASCO|nr:uncharacterized protein SCODWIG_00684 [Saccharomycodes ludwigii]